MIVRGSVEDVENAAKLLTVLSDKVGSTPLHHNKFLTGNDGADIQKISDEIADRVEDEERGTMTLRGEKEKLIRFQ